MLLLRNMVVMKMGTISDYQTKLMEHGATKRIRTKNKAVRDLLRLMPDMLSYHEVVINGVTQNISILSSDDLYEKKIHTLPGQSLVCGDVISWADENGVITKWLITEVDCDNTLQMQANIVRCNYVLKWKNSNGDLIERDCIVIDGTKYIIGETEKRYMTTGGARVALWIGHDEETNKLHRGMRFLMDNSDEDPMCYELTKPNRLSNVYDGHGIYKHILSECARNDEHDNYVEHVTEEYTEEDYAHLVEIDLDGGNL